MTPGHNRLAALIADFEEARAERERRAAARRRAEAARPRAGRTDGFARWDAAVFSNAAPDAEREAILEALRRSGRKGDAGARSPAYVARLLEETRAAGYALRDPDFGGDFDEGRAVRDDGRESLAVAIRLGTGAGALAPGTINVTWSLRVHRRGEGARLFAEAARRTAEEIAAKMSGG